MIKVSWLNILNNEKIWIKSLLEGINYKEEDQTELSISGNKNIIVINCNPNKYDFNKIQTSNFILIHLNDKNYMDDKTVYEKDNCKLIIRTYYMPSNNNKIIYIPIGTDINIENKLTPEIYKRKYIWSFCGHIETKNIITNTTDIEFKHSLLLNYYKNQRYNIINKMLKVKCNRYLYNSSTIKLENMKYKEILLNTVFLLCLPGNYQNETKRLYEGLESGCIPILIRKTIYQNYNYFEILLNSNIPFIYLDNYDNIDNIIKELVKTNLEVRRKDIIYKWNQYKFVCKSKIKKKILDLI